MYIFPFYNLDELAWGVFLGITSEVFFYLQEINNFLVTEAKRK